jgi:acetoin utilization protein AcuB
MIENAQTCFEASRAYTTALTSDCSDRQVQHYMESQPVTVSPDTRVHEAQAQMRRYDATHLPVIVEGRLVGLLSERDIQTVSPSPATSLSKWELNYLIDKLTVSEAMTVDVITVAPTTPLSEAVRLMIIHRIGALPVMEANRLVGLLTRDDILRIFLVDQGRPALAA